MKKVRCPGCRLDFPLDSGKVMVEGELLEDAGGSDADAHPPHPVPPLQNLDHPAPTARQAISEGVQEEIIEGEPTPAHDVFFLEWARESYKRNLPFVNEILHCS